MYQKAKKNPNHLEEFYNEIETTTKVPAKWETFVLGDMNSRLGDNSTISDTDIIHEEQEVMGKNGFGVSQKRVKVRKKERKKEERKKA